MLYNGLVVTTLSPRDEIVPESIYRGLCYGQEWPLDGHDDRFDSLNGSEGMAKLLTARSFAEGIYPLAVTSNLGYIRDYQARCIELGIEIRTLLCATTRQEPALDHNMLPSLLTNSTFLGFDYATSGADFSAVYDDFVSPVPSRLMVYTNQLNEYGLFASLEAITEYVQTRWKLIADSGERFVMWEGMLVRETELEDFGDFVIFQVRDVTQF